ncbi:hypothetical protein J2I47_21135 [Fibrella sp. HMF5335]|uniref:Uncharacterized protein n=1 Tax=Fibrella rubiginis TaxID=2817060 RepID=A0A939GH61_9BACT|nr:hypothetical protein [Fibrella rubiginis]MBO0939072.1 hypothetical protein [Fibrella rubiginis]
MTTATLAPLTLARSRQLVRRQLEHWLQATRRLAAFEQLASPGAWQGIDHTLSVNIRQFLTQAITNLKLNGQQLETRLGNAKSEADLTAIRSDLIQFRQHYVQCETTVHLYTDAINSRTTAYIAALMRACDVLCMQSMQELLSRINNTPPPPVMTYIDKGLGASILKAGLRLWDQSTSPVAVVKITQHNLFRPTAAIHETGHQVAHILDWNRELSHALRAGLRERSALAADEFAGWASEIAADAFAFVHTGYAAVAALHDVVAGSAGAVTQYNIGDPHPISYLRVLLGLEMCRQWFGLGPWDDLETSWTGFYQPRNRAGHGAQVIDSCVPLLPQAVGIILKQRYKAFGQRALSDIINPLRVKPEELLKLERIAGPGLFTNHGWIWKEALRLLALSGYKIAISDNPAEEYKQQEDWMQKLGWSVNLN